MNTSNAPRVPTMSPIAAPVPLGLRIVEGRAQLYSALSGLVLALGAAIAVTRWLPPETMLARIFDLHRGESMIPLTISWLFAWGLVYCSFRWRRIRALAALCTDQALRALTQRVTQPDSHAQLLEQLASANAQASPLLRRARAALQVWLTSPSLTEIDIVLQQHVVHDEDRVRAGYNLIRIFVWALPVIGLIGTVLGIALAVGGFAGFLGGNVDDVGLIKKNLVGVTGGLSFAFLITLHGLATSLVLMLVAAALQNREERLYRDTQQRMVDVFIPALIQALPSAVPDSHPERVDTQIVVTLDRLTHAIEAATRAQLESIATHSQAVTRELGRQLQVAQSVAIAMESLGQGTPAILAQQQALCQAIDRLQAAKIAASFEGVSHAIGAQSQATERLVGAVGVAANSTARMLDAQASVQSAVQQLAAHDVLGAVDRLRGTLAELQTVLAGLQRPFVLQAVPVPAAAGHLG